MGLLVLYEVNGDLTHYISCSTMEGSNSLEKENKNLQLNLTRINLLLC